MPLNYIKRLQQIKDILSDLYPIINKDYNKESSFAATFVFNNLFEECWKLMSELLNVYYGFGYSDNIKGSSKTISTAFEVGLIKSNRWKKMLLDRNNTNYDYRGQDLEYYFNQIKIEYVFLIEEFIEKAEDIIKEMEYL